MSWVRVRLARGDHARGWLHKDFVAAVYAAVERAGLPVARAGGRSRLRLVSGPPLAPEHVSCCEYLDMELDEAITLREFGRRLAERLPDGLEVMSVRRLPPGGANLRATSKAFCYTIGGHFDEERAERFRHAAQWPMARRRRERERVLDLKRSVSRLELRADGVEMVIEARPEGTPKPEEILESVFGISQEQARLLPTARIGIRFADQPRRLSSHLEQP